MSITKNAKRNSVSYNFGVFDGGSATITTRRLENRVEPSIFASFNTGNWIYYAESCGENCTVLFRKDPKIFIALEEK